MAEAQEEKKPITFRLEATTREALEKRAVAMSLSSGKEFTAATCARELVEQALRADPADQGPAAMLLLQATVAQLEARIAKLFESEVVDKIYESIGMVHKDLGAAETRLHEVIAAQLKVVLVNLGNRDPEKVEKLLQQHFQPKKKDATSSATPPT